MGYQVWFHFDTISHAVSTSQHTSCTLNCMIRFSSKCTHTQFFLNVILIRLQIPILNILWGFYNYLFIFFWKNEHFSEFDCSGLLCKSNKKWRKCIFKYNAKKFLFFWTSIALTVYWIIIITIFYYIYLEEQLLHTW